MNHSVVVKLSNGEEHIVHCDSMGTWNDGSLILRDAEGEICAIVPGKTWTIAARETKMVTNLRGMLTQRS